MNPISQKKRKAMSEPSPSPTDRNAMPSKAVYEWIKENLGHSPSMDSVTQIDIDFGPVGAVFERRQCRLVEEANPNVDLDDQNWSL